MLNLLVIKVKKLKIKKPREAEERRKYGSKPEKIDLYIDIEN